MINALFKKRFDELEAQFASLVALITDEEVVSPGALAFQVSANVARPNQGATKVAAGVIHEQIAAAEGQAYARGWSDAVS